MRLGTDRGKGDVLIWNQFGESACSRVINEEALVKDKFWNLKFNWICDLSSDFGRRLELRIRLDSNLHLTKNEGLSANLSLEKIRMVAYLPKLHHQIHQIFHLSFVFA